MPPSPVVSAVQSALFNLAAKGFVASAVVPRPSRVRFWNAVVGGYIPLKDLARILEQYPPFSQLCQQSLMPCIYDQLPLHERVRLRDFFRSENNHKVKETGADICLIHALNNCTGVPFMIRIRDMLWLQTHYSG